METDKITIRLPPEMIEDLKREAKKRGQTIASLARGYLMDGLAGYDAMGELLLQTSERIEKRLDRMEKIAAGHLHLTAEQQTLVIPKKPEEAQDDYAEPFWIQFNLRTRSC
jgi:hypothetical protein